MKAVMAVPEDAGPISNGKERLEEAWLALQVLVDHLSVVEKRLGTPLEQKGDYELVRELAHDIRNRMHGMQLWEEFRHCRAS